VLYTVKEERNKVHTVKGRKDNWIGHIWRRNRFLKHVTHGKIAGKIEVTGIREIRGKQLLDDRKERGGYWKLQEETLDHPLWKNGFGRECGSVARQTAV
jgi:hypothetical protein